jgi:hypothetical protein
LLILKISSFTTSNALRSIEIPRRRAFEEEVSLNPGLTATIDYEFADSKSSFESTVTSEESDFDDADGRSQYDDADYDYNGDLDDYAIDGLPDGAAATALAALKAAKPQKSSIVTDST